MNMGKNMHHNLGSTLHQNLHKQHSRKKKWNELSPMARFGTVATGIVQLSLLVAAQTDITRQGHVAACHPGELHRPGNVFHVWCEAPAWREVVVAAGRPPCIYWPVDLGRR